MSVTAIVVGVFVLFVVLALLVPKARKRSDDNWDTGAGDANDSGGGHGHGGCSAGSCGGGDSGCGGGGD